MFARSRIVDISVRIGTSFHLLQKKRFDGAAFNSAGSSYQMQWNIAEGYEVAYQEPGPGSIAIAETMQKVLSCQAYCKSKL